MEDRDHNDTHATRSGKGKDDIIRYSQSGIANPPRNSGDMAAFQAPTSLTPKMQGLQHQQHTQQQHTQQPSQPQPPQQYYPQTNGPDHNHQQPQPHHLLPHHHPHQLQHQHQHQHQHQQVLTPHPASAPPQQQQQHEYRLPSNGASIPSVSLPPIQHFEHTQNPALQQPHHSHMNGDAQHYAPPPPPPPQQQLPYQYQNGAVSTMMPSNAPVIYAAARDPYSDRRFSPPPIHPFPPHGHALPQVQLDPRQMSGGRHKKEIKRRTKTGCLTCRKRRIKCDERHPECRNCEKSKRECLGYDPIFKQQPGPAPIQPAPMTMSKPDVSLPTGYANPPFQGAEEIYNAVRAPPPPSLPQPQSQSQSASIVNGSYQSHAYAESLGNPPSHPGHNYHPPFDHIHNPEPHQTKA